jgi:HEAT repeat protein
MADRRVVPLLSQFRAGDWPKPIKLEAIKVLGNFRNPEASRALFGFLEDPDEEVRVVAANNVRVLTESALLTFLERLVRDKHFNKKTLAERQSICDLLGRSRIPRVYDLLQGLLRKRLGLFRRTEKISTRLCVIQAMERFPSPRSKEILERGTRTGSRVLRLACRSALARLKFPESTGRINPPEVP